MALRLRRGTDAQRLLITPLEGELIYTTDTQEIYVGDGVTAGGIRVTGDVPSNIQDLENVSDNVPGANDVLIWDALTAQWTPIPLDTIAPGSTLASLADVTFTNLLDNQILSYNTGTSSWINASSLTGNVLANDASLIVDATTGNISPVAIVARDNTLDLIPATAGRNELRVISDDARSSLKMQKRSTSDLSSDTTGWGQIYFERDDDINGSITTAIIQGGSDYIWFGANAAGDFSALDDFMVWRNGRLGLGTITPGATLDVVGSAFIRTELTVFGSVDIQNTLVANAIKGTLVADDSSIIVDGITGGVYPAELHSRNNVLELLPTIAGRNEFKVVSNDATSVLKMSRLSDSDLSVSTSGFGGIFFERNDEINGTATTAIIQGGSDYIWFAANNSGTFSDISDFMIWRNGSLGLGTSAPTATLDVRGSAVFTGDVTAAAFKGSYVLDDSTIIIDGTTGDIFLPSIHASDNVLELLPTAPGRNEFKVVSEDNRSILKMTRLSESDLSGAGGGWGSIFFERSDPINGSETTALIQGGRDSIIFAADSAADFFQESSYLTLKEGGDLGIGTFTPAAKLDVRGDALISGNLTASSIKGTLVGDDSTILVDGVNNKVVGPVDTTSNIELNGNNVNGVNSIYAVADEHQLLMNSNFDFTIFSNKSVNITADNLILVTSNVPATSVGVAGDRAGMMAVDNSYLYRCIADYDGVSDIWVRLFWVGGNW